jgi:hypothetical protein
MTDILALLQSNVLLASKIYSRQKSEVVFGVLASPERTRCLDSPFCVWLYNSISVQEINHVYSY